MAEGICDYSHAYITDFGEGVLNPLRKAQQLRMKLIEP